MSTADNSHTEKLRRLRQTTQAIFRKRALAHGAVSGFYRSEEGPSGTVEESVHLSTKLGEKAYTVQKAEAGPENGLGVVTIPPCCDTLLIPECNIPDSVTWVLGPITGVYNEVTGKTEYTVITNLEPQSQVYDIKACVIIYPGFCDQSYEYIFSSNNTVIIVDPLNRSLLNSPMSIGINCTDELVIDRRTINFNSPPPPT